MKAAIVTRLAIVLFIIPLLVSLLALPLQQARAQDSNEPEPSPKYSREELAQMLAPIALYPDTLLSQVLMASTYPIEVIEADRWIKKNSTLKDQALDDALLDKEWDPSVKALCHVPSVLALMSERIAETTSIGNAFLAQEEEVLAMVQELRAKAKAHGNLSTNTEQKVVVEKETIIIEQVNPNVIYVPYYDPWYIYGPWWYPAYPPYYWGPPGVSIGFGISYWPGVYFGFAFGSWSYFDWHYRHIYIDVHKRPRYVRHNHWRAKPGPWSHAPVHRRGVAYRDKTTARKYGQYYKRPKEFRPETRGFPAAGERGKRDLIDRSRINRETRRDTTTKIDRHEPERQRKDLNSLQRDRAGRVEKVQPRMEHEVQKQVPPQRIEPARQQQQERTREPVRREYQGVRTDQQMKRLPKVEPQRQERQRVEYNRQVPQRNERERSTQERVEYQQYQRGGDNVFNRVDDGRQEKQSSERGRFSRQRPDNYAPDRNRSSGGNRGGRSSQGNRERGRH